MTNVKIQRRDVLSQKEFIEMLEKADGYEQEYYAKRDQCMVSIFYITGKRRGELARLERVNDFVLQDLNLIITFTVEKKRKKQTLALRRPKEIPLQNPFSHYIVDYWRWMEKNHETCVWLFPRTFYSGLTKTITFDYEHCLSGRQVLRRVKALNENAWCHLFRETVGAQIVRRDPSIMSAFKVMLRLDLEDERTAMSYVRRFAIDQITTGIEPDEKADILEIIQQADLNDKQKKVLEKILQRIS